MPSHLVMFAYGSNMLTARLLERVPSAKKVGIGKLRGHVLKWHKRSKDNSGKCDIEYTAQEKDLVWGVLFQLEAIEKNGLDLAEGLNKGYAEKTVEVESKARLIKAQAYYATDIDAKLLPYHWYKKIVEAGARGHGLPGEYISVLETVISISDPDRERSATNERLLFES